MPARTDALDEEHDQHQARVRVAHDVTDGAHRVLAAAADEVRAFGRRSAHAAEDEQEGGDRRADRRDRSSLAPALDEPDRERGNEHRDGAEDVPHRIRTRALVRIGRHLRTERHVRHFEHRVRGVEAEHRDGDPRDERRALEPRRRQPQHQREAREQRRGRVDPGTSAPQPVHRAVAPGADERIGDRVPDLRDQEHRPHRGGRRREVVDRVLQVHDQHDEVHELRRHRGEPVGGETLDGDGSGHRPRILRGAYRVRCRKARRTES